MMIKKILFSISLALSMAFLSNNIFAKDEAWLMQHLPAQTESYIRIPAMWKILGLDGKEQPQEIKKSLEHIRPGLIGACVSKFASGAKRTMANVPLITYPY